ncbi:MAG: hypothetical protein IKP12_04600 [Acholeplasmatales bacterium]|nr:hypothetical protein [Acholeplasmatales bacterium]
MKLNKYKKLLKEEFENTINPIELKEEKKNLNYNHKFKFRYVFLPLLAVLLLFLIIDQIVVSVSNEDIKKYNASIEKNDFDFNSINITEKRYQSKLELEHAININIFPEKKELKKSLLEKIFSIRLVGVQVNQSLLSLLLKR